jgi:hypothetical protein
MLVNLASDKVEFFYQNEKTLLEKNNLERIFPKTLKQILKKYPTNNFYIIN